MFVAPWIEFFDFLSPCHAGGDMQSDLAMKGAWIRRIQWVIIILRTGREEEVVANIHSRIQWLVSTIILEHLQ